MSKKDHNTDNPQEKAHHQGVKEMPSSLPNQRISSDGKKLSLSNEEKQEDTSDASAVKTRGPREDYPAKTLPKKENQTQTYAESISKNNEK